MYICASCESVFCEPRAEDMGCVPYGDTYASLGEYDVCPVCGDEDIAEAAKCARCGEYKAASELTEGFCSACAAEVMKEFKAVLEEHFSSEEIELIKYIWD